MLNDGTVLFPAGGVAADEVEFAVTVDIGDSEVGPVASAGPFGASDAGAVADVPMTCARRVVEWLCVSVALRAIVWLRVVSIDWPALAATWVDMFCWIVSVKVRVAVSLPLVALTRIWKLPVTPAGALSVN